jgi:hypothetical protein
MNPFAGPENFLAFCQVATALPNEFSGIDIHIHHYLVRFARRVFLHDHGIRAGRDRRPSKNPNRLPGRNPELPIDPSRLLADHT